MASSDLQISSVSRPAVRAVLNPGYAQPPRVTVVPEPTLLGNLVRKRWRALFVCLLLSAGIAAGIAYRFARESAKVSTKLLHTGLPIPTGPRMYEPLQVGAAEALIASPENLNRIIQMHGLNVSPAVLGMLIEFKPPRAGVVEMALTWESPQKTVEILEDLNELFIEQVAEQRKQTLQDYIADVERALLVAKGKVAQATDRLRAELDKLGYVDDDFSQVSSGLAFAETSLVQSEISKLSLESQLKQVKEFRASVEKELKQALIEVKRAAIQTAMKRFAANNPQRDKFEQLSQKLDERAKQLEQDANEEGKSLTDWKADLAALGEGQIQEDEALAEPARRLQAKLDSLSAKESELELALLPKADEIERLKRRLEEKQKQLMEQKREAGEYGKSNERTRHLENELEDAEAERKQLQAQLNSLRQLESTRVREYAVVMPPAVESAIVASNAKKLFAGAFVLAMLALVTPLIAIEHLSKRANTVDEVAKIFGLPILSKELVTPTDDKQRLPTAEDDRVRLLALRIQQSIPAEGSVVAFSALDGSDPAVPLVCQIGMCLAEREERVLIIDANNSPNVDAEARQKLFADHPLSNGSQPVVVNGSVDANGASDHLSNGLARRGELSAAGLADFLQRDDMTVASVVQPTMIKGVSYVARGREAFRREAFASKRLTQLLQQCKQEYGVVLVIGPSAWQSADLQMLAARADGIVFTLGVKRMKSDQSYEALKELLELEAPVLGVVS